YRTSLANDTWTDPQAAATTINGKGDNANITWSSDGSKAYFTRCVEDKCRIFWIRLHDPEAQAKPLAGLGEGSSTQPMMVQWEDREMLLFVSDREDGAGGSDIWQAQIIGDSAQFVIPVNGKVNSIGNE